MHLYSMLRPRRSHIQLFVAVGLLVLVLAGCGSSSSSSTATSTGPVITADALRASIETDMQWLTSRDGNFGGQWTAPSCAPVLLESMPTSAPAYQTDCTLIFTQPSNDTPGFPVHTPLTQHVVVTGRLWTINGGFNTGDQGGATTLPCGNVVRGIVGQPPGPDTVTCRT